MKKTLTIAFLTLSLTAMANEIKCTGQTTESTITLSLTGMIFPIDNVEYTFKSKLIRTSGYEFSINSNIDTGNQKLTYKFKTLKRHALARKNSNLVLTIRQDSDEVSAFDFKLNPKNEATLKIEEEGSIRLIDRMDCK